MLVSVVISTLVLGTSVVIGSLVLSKAIRTHAEALAGFFALPGSESAVVDLDAILDKHFEESGMGVLVLDEEQLALD